MLEFFETTCYVFYARPELCNIFFYSFGKRWKREEGRERFPILSVSRTVYDLSILGGTGVRRARAGDSISHVEAVDGLYGDPAQERDRGETSVKVCDAFHRRRRRGHLLHKLPRGGPVRPGRLHQGIHGLSRRSTWRHRREASAHALLQVSHQLQQEELRERSILRSIFSASSGNFRGGGIPLQGSGSFRGSLRSQETWKYSRKTRRRRQASRFRESHSCLVASTPRPSRNNRQSRSLMINHRRCVVNQERERKGG